ncbi:MAG: sialidase family protein [bacterium]
MAPNGLTRRQFLKYTGATSMALAPAVGCATHGPAIRKGEGRIGLLKKEVFIPTQDQTGVFPGFVTYIHKRKPILLNRFGWVQASDTYDNFHDIVSKDNGETWSDPVLRLKSHSVASGLIRYCENTAFFDKDTNQLITAVSKFLYPEGKFNQDIPRQLEINVYDPFSDHIPDPLTLDFGLPGGICISFCFPIKTSSGTIVNPAITTQVNEDGSFCHHPKSGSVIHDVRMLLGQYQSNGAIAWHTGQPLRADPERSTRGFSESTPVELRDGRLALLCRGSNAGMPEIPGYKWLSFSEDDGETWSSAVPLTCDDGDPIESSATGGACFRSIVNQKLYFIGNLCPKGERADGNWPRSPLVIAEIQEEPFAIKRDTITVIDERGPQDSPKTQISNFRYYQDRKTGDVVVFATRFGERDAKQWRWADHYRYRVAIS